MDRRQRTNQQHVQHFKFLDIYLLLTVVAFRTDDGQQIVRLRQPEYQRDYVWTPQMEREWIMSIDEGGRTDDQLLTFHKRRSTKLKDKTGDGNYYDICNGVQRTTAIMRFMQGEFSAPWGGKECFYKDLSKEDQEYFNNYRMGVVILDDWPMEEVKVCLDSSHMSNEF